jgi:hypothetical protein
MKLSKAEMVKRWQESSAVFEAKRGPNIRHSPQVMVYPLKNGRGYMWLIWHGTFGVKEMPKNIKTGGTTARDFERACKLAVHELLVYRGKANE